MLKYFRQNNASIVAQLFKSGIEADAVVPGPKAKHKQGMFQFVLIFNAKLTFEFLLYIQNAI